jgi:hypothetical protein
MARNAPARSAPSGPGRFSRRDEKVQPIREPDIDNPDLQYGDRSRLTAAQRMARLPAGGQPRQTPPSTGGQPAPGTQPQLPAFIFDSPSAFPEQPVTAGLDMGPGPGSEVLASQQPPPDIREQTLMYLANGSYGGPPNPDAQQALAQLRNDRAAAAMPPLQPAPAIVPPTAPGAQAMGPPEPPGPATPARPTVPQSQPPPEEVLTENG